MVSRSTKSSEPATASVGDVERTESYGDIQYKDVVFVVDDYWKQYKGLKWQFLCHAYNVKSGREWLELFGGPRGHQGVHAFAVGSVRKSS